MIINNTINETIRKQLPVKHILKITWWLEFKEGNEEILKVIISEKKENLRKMVKAEIESALKEKQMTISIKSGMKI